MSSLITKFISRCRPIKMSTNVIRRELNTSSCLFNKVHREPDHGSNKTSDDKLNRPNLKAAGGNNKNSTMVMIIMGLGLLCMYPMVFRPMLFSEELGELQGKTMSKAGIDLDKARPTNMPAWTSPFDSTAKPGDK